MKKCSVYTRRGDDGTTSLASGQRVPKTHPRLEAYGTLDELNSHVGLLMALHQDVGDIQELTRIQNNLFELGAILATIPSSSVEAPASDPWPDEVLHLEHAIDCAAESLPPWRGFVLPGGTQAAAQAHVCRTICRRAERLMYAIPDLQPSLFSYVNRLSDYLFILARRINLLSDKEENIWCKRKNN